MAALATALPTSGTSKGASMMAKLGYKPGTSLGKSSDAGLSVPIAVEMKDDRSGIGALSEKKRKFREHVDRLETSEKKAQESAGEFRDRVAREREDKRIDGMWWASMKILEGLVEDTLQQDARRARTLAAVPLLYRPLIKDREDRERERRRWADFEQSNAEDRPAAGAVVEETEDFEQNDDLEDYCAKSATERLDLVLIELRQQWSYCFWCKYRYPSLQTLEAECPGISEDEHG